MASTESSRTLPDPPTDGITNLCYFQRGGSSEYLASSSWDGCLYIHDTSLPNSKLLAKQFMDAGPLLSLAPCQSGNILFTGGLDGSVRSFDIESNKRTTIGYHSPNIKDSENENPISCACSCLSSLSSKSSSSSTTQVLASSGWDSNFYLWDVRSANNNKPITQLKLPDKAYSMDVDPSTGTRIAIATAGRKVCVIDVRMMTDDEKQKCHASIVLERESSLKYQSRVCRFFPDGMGLAIGSIEGRVAVEFLNELGVKSNGLKKYAFKCHRDKDIVYPVNAISFHPKFGTFVTGGCDGAAVAWDGLHKKKLTVFPKFPTSIAALAFNHDGTELAIASSYTFEDGERDGDRKVKDEIYVRVMDDSEVTPKTVS